MTAVATPAGDATGTTRSAGGLAFDGGATASVLAVGARLANDRRRAAAEGAAAEGAVVATQGKGQVPELATGWTADSATGAADVVSVDSASAAIGVLRTVRVDLVAVGETIEGVASPWEFVRTLRAAWPSQKWAFVPGDTRADSLAGAGESGADGSGRDGSSRGGSGEGPDASPVEQSLLDAKRDRDELAARQLGAVAVLEGPEAWRHVAELAQKLRRARPQQVVPGLRLRPAATPAAVTAGA